MKTILDVIGRPIEVKKTDYVVTATDKLFSGWGMAEGKICKRLVLCDDLDTAIKVSNNMRKQGFTYVSCRSVGRCGIPYYLPSRYVVSWHHAEDCPIWNK